MVATAVAIAALALVAVTGGLAAGGLLSLALAALFTAYRHPFFIGPLVALLLPAGEIHVHVFQAQVAPLEAVVGGAAIGYVARVVMQRERIRFRLADWLFVLLLVCIALSTLGPVDDSDRLRELLFWGSLGVVFHVVIHHSDKRRDLTLLLVALASAVVVESSVALYEYVSRWSDRFSLLDGAIVFPLPEGTLGHPNGLAQFLVIAVLGVLALSLAESGRGRHFALFIATVGSLALVVTFSRASWIAFVAGSCVYLVERRTRVPVLVAGALAVVGGGALAALHGGAIGARISSLFGTERSGLYDFRIELIERASRIAAEHPFTGSGHFVEIGVYAGRPDLATHPHNLYVGLAVFFGIPAATTFSALVLLALRAAWRGYRTRMDERRLTSLGFVGVIVALLVNGLLEYPFWNTSLTVLVVLVLAVAMTFAGEDPDEPGTNRAPLAS